MALPSSSSTKSSPRPAGGCPVGCLLLGIAREDWLAAALQGLHPGVEMLAVRVAVRVLASLTGRACSLYAVVRRMAPRAHKREADPVPLRFELGRALADTLARPAPR